MEDDQDTQDAHDALSSRAAAPLRFETFAQARAWSQANPGKVFTRAGDGRGFESKHVLPVPPVVLPNPGKVFTRTAVRPNPGKVFARAADGRDFESKPVLPVPPVVRPQAVSSYQEYRDIYSQKISDIKVLAPHLHDVLYKSSPKNSSAIMWPFDRRIWEDELGRLNTAQLSRLRLLVTVGLEDTHERLRQLYAQMRRVPCMKANAGWYGEPLIERLNEVMEETLKDIDQRLPARSSNDGDCCLPL